MTQTMLMITKEVSHASYADLSNEFHFREEIFVLVTMHHAVAGLRGGLRGHGPTLLLDLCRSHANICTYTCMQEFLTQFCGVYLY